MYFLKLIFDSVNFKEWEEWSSCNEQVDQYNCESQRRTRSCPSLVNKNDVSICGNSVKTPSGLVIKEDREYRKCSANESCSKYL